MAISNAEAAMYAYITGRVLPKGTSRAVMRAAYKGAISAGTFVAGRISPPVARGALGVGRAAVGVGAGLARRNPGVATAGALYVLNESGQLDPVKEFLGEANEAGMENLQTEFIQPAKKAAKKVTTKFNKAVSAGMKGLKKSASMGKKGVLSAPKKAFSKVTKIASRINRAKKMKLKMPKRPKGKTDRLVYDITKRILA